MLRQVVPGAIVVATCFGMAGCANEAPLTSSLTPVSVLSIQAQTPTERADALVGVEPGKMPKKTMSDKVLAAIALERVTGLKADPGQLRP
ncbi:MAG: hypothetical protein ACKVP7_14140 [Hyphomicrobiaceae bacterium]